jgi:hypothetical protein
LDASLDLQLVYATASEFLRKYVLSKGGRAVAKRHTMDKDDYPKPSKRGGDQHCADEMMPVEIKFACGAERKAYIERNLSKIISFLADDKYFGRPFQVDNYLALFETFTFLLGMRSKLMKHFGVVKPKEEDDDSDEEPIWPCDVCGDPSYAVFCGSNACGKCKAFLCSMMRGRRSVSLRCAKSNDCSNEFGQVDVTCDSCRIRQCRKIGMVDEFYYTEMQQPSTSSCAVCQHDSSDMEVRASSYT